MGTKWRNSVSVEDTTDGSIMTLPKGDEYYYNFTAYKFYPNSAKLSQHSISLLMHQQVILFLNLLLLYIVQMK